MRHPALFQPFIGMAMEEMDLCSRKFLGSEELKRVSGGVIGRGEKSQWQKGERKRTLDRGTTEERTEERFGN